MKKPYLQRIRVKMKLVVVIIQIKQIKNYYQMKLNLKMIMMIQIKK